jgi:hypothetical protein
MSPGENKTGLSTLSPPEVSYAVCIGVSMLQLGLALEVFFLEWACFRSWGIALGTRKSSLGPKFMSDHNILTISY